MATLVSPGPTRWAAPAGCVTSRSATNRPDAPTSVSSDERIYRTTTSCAPTCWCRSAPIFSRRSARRSATPRPRRPTPGPQRAHGPVRPDRAAALDDRRKRRRVACRVSGDRGSRGNGDGAHDRRCAENAGCTRGGHRAASGARRWCVAGPGCRGDGTLCRHDPPAGPRLLRPGTWVRAGRSRSAGASGYRGRTRRRRR